MPAKHQHEFTHRHNRNGTDGFFIHATTGNVALIRAIHKAISTEAADTQGQDAITTTKYIETFCRERDISLAEPA